MSKTKNKKNSKIIKVKKIQMFILLVLIIVLTYTTHIILNTDILLPKLDETKANYISFNNSNSTDMLKITNVKKLSDKIGKSKFNKQNINIEVNGKLNDEFEINIYPNTNKIDKKYIKYVLYNNDIIFREGSLIGNETSLDEGVIIYKGKITKNNKYKLKIWIDNSYKKEVNNISYEIKVKSR